MLLRHGPMIRPIAPLAAPSAFDANNNPRSYTLRRNRTDAKREAPSRRYLFFAGFAGS